MSLLSRKRKANCPTDSHGSRANLEIRVYPGADGTFTLYEDEGDTYNYEKGQYATITFQWNDRARKLTIGSRQGSYQGMLQQRKFTLVLPNGQQKVVYNSKDQNVFDNIANGTTPSSMQKVRGDLNFDGKVNGTDRDLFNKYINSYQSTYSRPALWRFTTLEK